MAAGGFAQAEKHVANLFLLPSFPLWQLLIVACVLSWLVLARFYLLTQRIRSAVQPFVTSWVEKGIPMVLRIQKWEHPLLDILLASIASVVSVEFYTAFLPLLFWSGHVKLARQLTVLMAVCIYVGNCIKDLVCAPRPPSPPVRRLHFSEGEKESAQEYGLPSSHSINTICLSGYLLHYLVRHLDETANFPIWVLATLLAMTVLMVLFGRIYLGMHSPVDVIAGAVIGGSVLLGWCMVDEYVDTFITAGENVVSFWASIAVLLLFAYPAPELRTPSFEYHTAFNGVVLGVICGVNQTYSQYHSNDAPVIPMSTLVGVMALMRRLVVGLPVILVAKAVSKALAIRLLPLVCNIIGLPARSSYYVADLNGTETLKIFRGGAGEVMDVDTGIRLVQYAGLGWAVVQLTPFVFECLAL